MPGDRFEPLIRSVTVRKPSLPLRRLLLEALVLAEFVETHWEPRRAGRALLPGLGSAAGAAGLEREVVGDLRDLAHAVQSLDSELTATKTRVVARPVAEARRLLGELRAPRRFLLRGRAATRRALEKVLATARVHSALGTALALEAHASLAEAHARELARLGDVAADLPERARRLALALREPTSDLGAADARSAKLRRRDALVTLLMDRMRAVRAAVRFAFREHPKLVRQVTSDYERKRKQKSLRKRARARRA